MSDKISVTMRRRDAREMALMFSLFSTYAYERAGVCATCYATGKTEDDKARSLQALKSWNRAMRKAKALAGDYRELSKKGW